jgi:hypothetical protein
MVDWNAGAVFGIIWVLILPPIHTIGTVLFWQRREIQPIKARSPGLVVLSDIILLLWVILLCIQRIERDQYPCLLNVWSGFIGLVVLFNTYIWRCWVLYFTFGITQERLDGVSKQNSLFVKNRYFISAPFAFKFMGSLTVILVLPCGILTSTSQVLPGQSGEGCNLEWGLSVLAVYVGVYVCIFLWFAFKLRQVVDGFKIKEEMKLSGTIAVIVFIPWVIFNQSAKTINRETFPFSTLFLLLGVSSAFAGSTLWPLYRTYQPLEEIHSLQIPEDVNTLHGVLSTAEGVKSFRKYLTTEFSVENILFYSEVEEYRAKKKEQAEGKVTEEVLLGEAQRIYAKYIINDAPFQVNLPDQIMKELEDGLKELFSGNGQVVERVHHGHGDDLPNQKEMPTIFDAAQRNIYKLMSTDSFPRYQRSDEYREYLKSVEDIARKKKVLGDQGLLEKEENGKDRKRQEES